MSSTFTAKASKVGYTKSSSASTWYTAGAFQGTYEGGYPRVGGMLFSTLRNVTWSDQIIEGIKLKLTFDAAGYNRAKTVYLYRGTKNTLSGTGSAFKGAYIGGIATGGKAFSQTLTMSVTGTALTRLTDMLQNSSINTLCTYTSEEIDGSSGYSDNYMMITAAQMIITYSPKGSSGTLDRSSVPAGESIGLTVTPLSGADTDSLTHTVTWAFGGQSETQTLEAGVLETEYTVPMDWLTEIPGAASGTATCTLTTAVDGTTQGSKSYSFTVTAPASAAPTFDAEIEAAGQVTAGYYQYLSAATIRAANAAAQYGASITAYSITGSESASGSTSELTTAAFLTSGTHEYTLSVTDSRGMTTVKTVSCEVAQVLTPGITRFEVERYSAIEGDEITYVRTDYGPNVWINLEMSIDPADGNNAAEAYILYGKIGATERTRVDIAMEDAVSVTEDRTIISAEISANDGWEFTLYLTDKANGAVAYDLVSKGVCILHRAGNGWGLGVGGFVTDGTEDTPLFKSFWESHFQTDAHFNGAAHVLGGLYEANGYRMDKYAKQENLTMASGWAVYNTTYAPRVTRVGPLVFLDGMAKNTSATNTSTVYTIATLPEWAYPATDVHAIMQGSGRAIFWLRVYSDGTVRVTRYRTEEGYVAASVGSQFPLSLSWIAADAFDV